MSNPNDLPFRSATIEREVSDQLRTLVARIVRRDPAMAGRFDAPGVLTDAEQEEAIIELCKSVDQNAFLRGQSQANPEDLADAWDEGAAAVEYDQFAEEMDIPRNPYRAEESPGEPTPN